MFRQIFLQWNQLYLEARTNNSFFRITMYSSWLSDFKSPGATFRNEYLSGRIATVWQVSPRSFQMQDNSLFSTITSVRLSAACWACLCDLPSNCWTAFSLARPRQVSARPFNAGIYRGSWLRTLPKSSFASSCCRSTCRINQTLAI